MGVFMVCFITFIGLLICGSVLYFLLSVGRGDVITHDDDNKVKR
mgnify:CR=1 FL=1